MTWKIHTADVLAAMAEYPDNHFDACETDAPYGLSDPPDEEEILEILRAWLNGERYVRNGSGFMGKEWDAFVPGPEVWRELLRVLKPGASAFVFAGDRTMDLMAMSLRIAGFEVRGVVPWLYGSGFPKSMNIGKALDQHLGAEREVIGQAEHTPKFGAAGNGGFNDLERAAYGITAPATPEAEAWEGHGTALKPGFEPAILVMKPNDGTYAANALRWDVAGLNIDAARIKGKDTTPGGCKGRGPHFDGRPKPIYQPNGKNAVYNAGMGGGGTREHDPTGRWPSNVAISEDVAAALGPLAHYFYTAKPDRAERDAGLDHFETKTAGEMTSRQEGSAGLNNPRAGAGRLNGGKNLHPTVKPIALTRYLASLLLPPRREDGPRRILVPFSGSGSEMIGALLAGWEEIVGIDLDPEYTAIAEARLTYWANIDTPKSKGNGQMGLFDSLSA